MLSKSVDGADLINLWERTWSTFSPVLSRLKWRLWYLGFHILFPVLCSFSGGHHEIYLCTIACIDARKLNSAFLVLTPMEFSIAPPPPPPNYLANPLLGLLDLNPSSTNMFWHCFLSSLNLLSSSKLEQLSLLELRDLPDADIEILEFWLKLLII